MKIACYSLILKAGYNVPATIEILSRLGYAGVEWRVREDFHLPVANLEEQAEEIKTLCANAGLAIPALCTYLSLGQTEEVGKVLRAAAKMGAGIIRLNIPHYDGARHYTSLLDEARRDLAKLEGLCRETGVKAGVELHFGTIAPSASAGRRLVQDFSPDWVGMTFDPGNMVREGLENWKMGIQMLGPYLAHVHVKNGGWYHSEKHGWQFAWTPLNDGLIKWEEVIAFLAENDYQGWLSLEDLADLPIEQKLEEDIALLREWIG
jgi:sugar phosphate isomerase/epimerase